MTITIPNIVGDNITFGETSGTCNTSSLIGDLLIAFICAKWGQSVSLTSPGWLLLKEAHGAFKVYGKIATSDNEAVGFAGPDPSICEVYCYRKPAGDTWRIIGVSHDADSSGSGNGFWRVASDAGDVAVGDVVMAISASGNDPGNGNVFWTGLTGYTFAIAGATLATFGSPNALNNGGGISAYVDQAYVTAGSGSAIQYDFDYTFNTASTGGTVFVIVRAATIPIVGEADVALGLCAEADTEITLVSPTPIGSEIEAATPVVIHVVDPDAGRTFETTIKVNTATVYTTSGGWAAGYAVGTGEDDAEDITDGSRYTIDPDEDWTECVFVEVSVVDEDDLTTRDFFYWQFVAVEEEPAPEPPPADDGGPEEPAGIQGDVKIAWAEGLIDTLIEDDDVAVDQGLRTSVLLSLFTDRRAEDDDALPGDDGDRRGWWADELAALEGDRMGSRLWLLERSKRFGDVAQRAEEMIREALAWMLEDRVAAKLDVAVTAAGDQLASTITIHRPAADPVTFRFDHVWEHTS